MPAMIPVNSSIDKVFDDMLSTFNQIQAIPQSGLSYQVKESADQHSVILEVEVPGVDPDSVKVDAKGRAIVVECPRGSTYVTVGSRLNLEGITASIKWGLLTVLIPRRDSKSVSISVAKEDWNGRGFGPSFAWGHSEFTPHTTRYNKNEHHTKSKWL